MWYGERQRSKVIVLRFSNGFGERIAMLKSLGRPEVRLMNFNTLKTTLLLAGLTGLLMLLGYGLGGNTGLVIGFVFAVAMNFGSYWFSDRIALKMAGAREVSAAEAPELHDLAARLAQASGLPKPRVAIIESAVPNAFATGRNAQHGLVAVTTGILHILNRRELAAVLAHELGHIRNRDILVSAVAATLAGAITMLAQMGQFALFFGGRSDEDEEGGGGLLGGLLMLLLAPLAATIIQLAISRSREFGADRTGAQVGRDPEALASALEKLEAYSRQIPLPVNPAVSHLFIVQPLTGFSVQSLFSTHPPTAERVARLRQLARQSGTPTALDRRAA
jgi:heat shock protein HtpX